MKLCSIIPRIFKRVKYAAAFITVVLYLLSIPVLIIASEDKSFSRVVLDFNGPVLRSGIPSPWKLRINKGEAYARIVADGGEPALHLRSSSASFSLERDLRLKTSDYPYLNWTWKALAIPPNGDLRIGSQNDQVLQLMIAFEGGRVLSYVWDSNAPEGTVSDESIGIPLFITVKVMVVKSGTSERGKWLQITRNLYQDYKSVFKEKPRNIRGIRVQTNSQYTGELTEGLVRQIIFSQNK